MLNNPCAPAGPDALNLLCRDLVCDMTVGIAIAVHGWGRLEAADRGIFVVPAVKVGDEVAAELDDRGMRRDAALDFPKFITRFGRSALLKEFLGGEYDRGIAVVERGRCLQRYLHLHMPAVLEKCRTRAHWVFTSINYKLLDTRHGSAGFGRETA